MFLVFFFILILLFYFGYLGFFNIIDLSLDNSYYFMLEFPFVPAKGYSNPYSQKKCILSDNKDKSGIYCWVNKLNGNFYIGSSSNLRARLIHYYTKS